MTAVSSFYTSGKQERHGNSRAREAASEGGGDASDAVPCDASAMPVSSTSHDKTTPHLSSPPYTGLPLICPPLHPHTPSIPSHPHYITYHTLLTTNTLTSPPHPLNHTHTPSLSPVATTTPSSPHLLPYQRNPTPNTANTHTASNIYSPTPPNKPLPPASSTSAYCRSTTTPPSSPLHHHSIHHPDMIPILTHL